MDTTLRCNSQANGSCRKNLTQWAIVTTCSHIFCRSCADHADITNAGKGLRKCPACSTELHHDHDVVATNLKPSEEYKTTVLSGLDPSTIMECASKALAFWNYQMSEEIRYQEHFVKALTDKCGHFSNALDQVVNEGNAEIERLSDRVERMTVERTDLLQKNSDAVKLLRDKSKRYLTIQRLYDALKQKVQNEQQQGLVAVDAERKLESIGAISRPETYADSHRLRDFHDSTPIHQQKIAEVREEQTRYLNQRSGSMSGAHSDIDANMMPPPSMKHSRQDPVLQIASAQRTPLVTSERSRSPHVGLPIPILGSHSREQHSRPASVQHPRYRPRADRNQGPAHLHNDGFPSAIKIGSATDRRSFSANRHGGYL